MKIIVDGNIDGAFYGFNGGLVFKLTNGQIWEQAEYKYLYHYAYRPKIQIIEDRGTYHLKVEGLTEMVKIKKVR